MDLNTAKGQKVVFLNRNGYDPEREHAASILETGAEYTVQNIKISNSYSSVRVAEFPDTSFNTVMFENVGSDWARTQEWNDDYYSRYPDEIGAPGFF